MKNENSVLREEPRVMDLFCGAGGLSQGFKEAGYELVLALDNDEEAIKHYNMNVKEVAKKVDLRSVDIGTLPKVDGILGGPPCQGFSLAGKRNPDDERSSLVFVFTEIVGEIKPKFFVMENVKGLESMNAKKELKKMFKDRGYDSRTLMLEAHDFGAPQWRERMFFIGFRKDLKRNLKKLDEILENFENNGTSVKDALDSFDHDYFYRHPYSYGRRAVYSAEEPYPTVRTVHRPMPDNYEFHDNDATRDATEVRHLTEEELAIIQTFPKNFKWESTKTTRRRLIGNAVPPVFGEAIGKAIKKLPERTTLKDF